ncbi:MAG: hypothetical protein LBI19_09490 [Oscillospiraceae bacterium]|jgi:RNA polymerase sigma factor (sigma-70 family)|nr:hypothetical protein [Oscillospiraceae bacterium]
MTKQNMKEYRSLCEELRQLDGQRLMWLSRAERSTRAPSKTPVLGGQHDPMPIIVDRLSEIREQADRLYNRLVDAKLRIERAIDKLPSVQRQLMRARYIEGKCWGAIAKEMGYSEERLYQLHRKALGILFSKK